MGLLPNKLLDQIKDDINKGDFKGVAARMRTFNKVRMIWDAETGELREINADEKHTLSFYCQLFKCSLTVL